MTIDRVGGGALVLFAVYTLWEARKLPMGNVQNPGPAYAPTLLALLLLVFAVVIVALGAGSSRIATVGWSEWRHAVAIIAVCIFMALSLERLGYRITVVVALMLLIGLLERRSIVTTALFSVGFSAATFYLFATVLRVPLPRGPWGF
ncbi:MAG: tripartite tricarboxylate transporter TctB family protein [Candidatus Rokubacteria bacterium]|nr:tripartite tricarboxylate transporter TctB family protein [Candidatus Rokubacteria bacterium]